MSAIIKANRPRSRGFVDYRPQAKARVLIENIQQVLDDYVDYLPLTIRQVFYQLFSRDQLEKTETAYKDHLVEKLGKARRGRLISMEAIRDDGFQMDLAPGWRSEQRLVDAFRRQAGGFTLDRQQGQERRVMLWCEAQGMVPQLERVAHPYGVRVASSGGFDSITTKHAIGAELAKTPTLVLHLGDFDPTGVHIYGSLDEDVRAFCEYYGGETEFHRLAVTPAQIDHYSLPTAPVKTRTDGPVFDSATTTQCEALPPDILAGIVRQAIEAHMDLDVLAQVKAEELEIRERLTRRFKSWDSF